jgi:hypothetical protein
MRMGLITKRIKQKRLVGRIGGGGEVLPPK